MMEIERLIAVWSTREEMQDLPTLETPVGFSTASGVWAPCQTHKSREWLPSGKETLFLPMINYLHSVDRSWSYSRRSWDVPNPSESQAVQPDTGQVSPGGVFPEKLSLKLGNLKVCCSSFSMMAMERRFPHRLKDMDWKQRLRAGRMALRWESLIPHCSKYNPWRVAALSPAELGGARDWSRSLWPHSDPGPLAD